MKAGKPSTNSGRYVSYWKKTLLRGRLEGQHFFSLNRSFFGEGHGGSLQPVASEEALSLVYATY